MQNLILILIISLVMLFAIIYVIMEKKRGISISCVGCSKCRHYDKNKCHLCKNMINEVLGK